MAPQRAPLGVFALQAEGFEQSGQPNKSEGGVFHYETKPFWKRRVPNLICLKSQCSTDDGFDKLNTPEFNPAVEANRDGNGILIRAS